MKIPFPHRTVKTATYVPSSERPDEGRGSGVLGDVTEITFEECDHVMLGNPIAYYKIGSKTGCYQCALEEDLTNPAK